MNSIELMNKAINDSNTTSYQWVATGNRLYWSYGVDFEIRIDTDSSGNKEVIFRNEETDISVCVSVVSRKEDMWLCDSYHDFVATLDDAIYWAARKIISKAERLF